MKIVRTGSKVVSETILLIEDDHRLAEMIRTYLGEAGWRVQHAGDGATGLALLGRKPFDVVVLDLMLPDMDGLDVCRQIRSAPQPSGLPSTHVPILMLTARGDAMDRVIGLEIGADDYLAKPFEPRELLARLRALVRRSRAAPAAGGDVLAFGRLDIDRSAREARLDGAPVALTSAQFGLLLALAEHAGRVLSRDTLMDLLKGHALDAFDRSIDVHVSRIRAVIEDDPRKPRRVLTVRGAGYVFAKAQE